MMEIKDKVYPLSRKTVRVNMKRKSLKEPEEDQEEVWLPNSIDIYSPGFYSDGGPYNPPMMMTLHQDDMVKLRDILDEVLPIKRYA